MLNGSRISPYYQPFAQYKTGEVTPTGNTSFVFKKSSNCLWKVTGYGTENCIFEYGHYQWPGPVGVYGFKPGSYKWFPMKETDIQEFKQLISKSNSIVNEISPAEELQKSFDGPKC